MDNEYEEKEGYSFTHHGPNVGQTEADLIDMTHSIVGDGWDITLTMLWRDAHSVSATFDLVKR